MASLLGTPIKTQPSSNAWVSAMGGFGNVDSDGNAMKADYNSSGVALGYDSEVNNGWLAGVAFSYTNNHIDMSAGDTDIDSYQLAAYGHKQWDNVYLDATTGIGHHHADSTRFVQFPGFAGLAQADYNINGIDLSLEAGKHYALSANNRVIPFAGLEYGYYRQQGFTETGAGVASLSNDGDNMDSLRSVLGVRLGNVQTSIQGTRSDMTLSLAWAHEFLDRNATVHQAFAVSNGVDFLIDGPETNRDRALVSLGASVNLARDVQLGLDYTGEITSSDQQHAFSATLQVGW